MGVPSFFRQLITKYQNILKKSPDKNIRALYIDANCLFHPQCFKVLDLHKNEHNQDKLFEYMSKRIIEYIDYLIRLNNPEEIVYIAVDGIAPLAKISQQRKRRFGYANDYRNDIYKKHNIIVNDSWSNIVITPGTQFMYNLHNKLRIYYKKMMTKKDKLCKFKIIYNSYLTPGEGEHKILQHIKNKYFGILDDSAIIIYGLDADLIFLALASQVNNIYLLRESNQIIRNDDNEKYNNDTDDNIKEELIYVDINYVKESINNEFNDLYKKFIRMDENYDIFENGKCKNDKNIINNSDINFTNDYIFICYFLGNDFLPHLPSIDINMDGLNVVTNAYIKVFETIGETIIKFDIDNKVIINDNFLKQFISTIATQEEDFFKSIFPEYIKKHKMKKCFEYDNHKKDLWYVENLKNVKIDDKIKLGYGEPHEWKSRYYSHYFKTSEYMQQMLNDICHNYLEGLLWVTNYYFDRCPSWKWQYMYTHAPFLSDIMIYIEHIKSIKNINIEYHEPIGMFTQLVSVIPHKYSHILPSELQHLNSTISSPIIDMFPIDYDIDMINKTQLYKCIPIIPYLDIDRVEYEVNKIKLTKKSQLLCSYSKPLIY